MTAISMYRASIPVFKLMLTNLSAILDRANTYAEARKIDPAVLLKSRLAPDMFDLTRNVQIAVDGVRACVARLVDVEIPVYEQNETSFAQLKIRIAKTIEFMDTFKPAQLDGTEDKLIEFNIRENKLQFKGIDYLLNFVHMNLQFHVTVVYSLLRHNGLDLGKRDYLGR